ncbi:hypothetical protein [Bradyrhizobium cenepequi]
MTATVNSLARKLLREVLQDLSRGVFAFDEAASDAVSMMNTPYFPRKNEIAAPMAIEMKDDDWARAALAGTRMLIAEESFDAMVQMLIDAGLVPKSCAAVMLDRLSARLLTHASGRTETHWAIRAPELIDQATRLSTKAATLRCSVGAPGLS